ncbi:hypothetical protein [Deinococcus aquaedulcis]|uniref:hypothetical protein n=1 Tax=Deinococcus aquaedulcis TaxID=2840455 RepID=UPI001C82A784|nr:hypothetical protein [Deinococcus aquaedulcis]
MADAYNVRDLMPLYLPSGWLVVKNYFFDKDPPRSDTPLENERYFGEDLLALRYSLGEPVFTSADSAQPVYYIWLGWSPEYSVEGQYVLTAACDDEDIARFETRDRQKITRAIQYWTQLISSSEVPLREIKLTHKLFETESRDGKA